MISIDKTIMINMISIDKLNHKHKYKYDKFDKYEKFETVQIKLRTGSQ